MATSAAAAKAPVEAPAAPPKKKSRLLLIVVLLLVMIGAGGAGAWWFLGREAADEDEVELADAKPPIFLPLEQFTVNLQAEDGQQFLQTAVTLKLAEAEIAEAIKAQMPQVRSRVLFLLSSKKPSQLASLEGKNKLSEEIIQEVEASLPAPKKPKKAKKSEDEDAKKKAKKAKAKAKDEAAATGEPAPRRVLAVYFTHFIVQ